MSIYWEPKWVKRLEDAVGDFWSKRWGRRNEVNEEIIRSHVEQYEHDRNLTHRPIGPKIPGFNVDGIDISAGLTMLAKAGYDPEEDSRTFMVIEYALQRWARGEEEQAERGAIDKSWYGVELTVWKMVLAAAMAAHQANRVP